MRITAYADRLIADLDRARLARADQDDAAQLDRPLRGCRASTSRCAGRRPHRGLHHPPRHRCSAPRSWCWRPSTRSSTPCTVDAGPSGDAAGRGPAARPPRPRRSPPTAARRRRQRARAPGRGPGQDRRVPRRLRHQPGHRRADPGLRRRLRADGLRHRRHHGRAGQDQRDWDFADAFGLPIVRTVQPPERLRRARPTSARAGHQQRASSTAWAWPTPSGPSSTGSPANGYGEGTVTYKLRDWLFSRQRYWGEPFPIVYDETGLPIALPDVDAAGRAARARRLQARTPRPRRRDVRAGAAAGPRRRLAGRRARPGRRPDAATGAS